MNVQPLVTVYIPTYNRVKLLKRAVESVRNQTYKNLEIIIVDDCSQDDTALYLEEISKQDPRISYYLKEKNSGACASRNIAIKHAKGEYITGLDDDDIFLSKRIKDFVEYSKKYDMNNSFLFAGHKFDLNKKITLKNKVRLLLNKKKVSQKDLLMNNYIGNQIFVKTSLIRTIGGFDEELRMWQDLDCWYRLLANSTAYFIPKMNYCIDTKHDYERITNMKKLNQTYTYFCQKHKLDSSNKAFLKLHFFPYGVTDIPVTLFVKRILLSKNLMDLLIFIRFIRQLLKP